MDGIIIHDALPSWEYYHYISWSIQLIICYADGIDFTYQSIYSNLCFTDRAVFIIP